MHIPFLNAKWNGKTKLQNYKKQVCIFVKRDFRVFENKRKIFMFYYSLFSLLLVSPSLDLPEKQKPDSFHTQTLNSEH